MTKFETNHFQYLIKWLYILFPGEKTYYHYTDQRGVEGIEKSKEIKASTDTTNDAVFGPGKSVSFWLLYSYFYSSQLGWD